MQQSNNNVGRPRTQHLRQRVARHRGPVILELEPRRQQPHSLCTLRWIEHGRRQLGGVHVELAVGPDHWRLDWSIWAAALVRKLGQRPVVQRLAGRLFQPILIQPCLQISRRSAAGAARLPSSIRARPASAAPRLIWTSPSSLPCPAATAPCAPEPYSRQCTQRDGEGEKCAQTADSSLRQKRRQPRARRSFQPRTPAQPWLLSTYATRH